MRYQNLKSFQKHLTSAAPHHLSRVYLVAMTDDFERMKALNSVLALLLANDSLVSRFQGSEFDLRSFVDALQSPSLLGGESILFLDEAEKISKKTMQNLLDILERQSLSSYVLIGSRSKTALHGWAEKGGVILDLTEEKPWDREKRLLEQMADQAKEAGKKISMDVLNLLIERLDKEPALLTYEMEKLICYVGDRASIERDDVLQISAATRTHTLWQVAEEIVWDRGMSAVDATQFHGMMPLLRSQLQLGLKLATLIETKRPSEEWSAFLPKLWPKVLEKKSSLAARLGSVYFRKGLEKLFEIELASRHQSTQYGALMDLFRSQLIWIARSLTHG